PMDQGKRRRRDMRKVTSVVAGVGSLALMAAATGCSTGAAGPEEAESIASVDGALTVIDWPALPICNLLRRGDVYYVKEARQLVYCDGGAYKPLDGLEGGASHLVKLSGATTKECPTGGVVIQVGADANKDGLLDSVTASATVCNGAQGP